MKGDFLDVMGRFAAHIPDGDWPEMAWEGASEQLRRSRESVFEPPAVPAGVARRSGGTPGHLFSATARSLRAIRR